MSGPQASGHQIDGFGQHRIEAHETRLAQDVEAQERCEARHNTGGNTQNRGRKNIRGDPPDDQSAR